MRALLILMLIATVVGCATYFKHNLDQHYGCADPARYDRTAARRGDIDFARDVKPILDNRCVVCHGCYDAPCQLKLSAYEGITRGANKNIVYDAGRLIAAAPTRLFIDANNNAAWRDQGFFPVLNERADTAAANRDGSVMYRLLALKRAHGLPQGAVLHDKDFTLDRAQQCPRIEEMDRFETMFPLWGMPFGLPALNEREHETLTRWIEAGAPNGTPQPLSASHAQRVAQWEQFLNGDSLKAQLMSRYIYEHWFVGHLYFDDLPGTAFFELVRSASPPGEPLRLIASRRPYDDPGVARVYYRLRQHQETLLTKTHLPYALNPARLAKFKTWFLDAAYDVTELPSYAPEDASNPFITFRQLPVDTRSEHESTTRLLRFHDYAQHEENILRAKSEFLNQRLGPRDPPRLHLLWNGEGTNPNAALTGFRHFDGASVVQGLVGEHPKTVLVLGYPLLERTHYLLVAGFDVYGNVGHQLATRLYMDFLRMEAELNFLTFLPRTARQPVHDYWYRDADPSHIEHLRNVTAYYDQDTGISFRSDDPLTEMYALLQEYMAPISSTRYDVATSALPAAAQASLQQLSNVVGPVATRMPETAFLTVRDDDGRAQHFTVLRHSAHLNVATPFGEEKARAPEEDQLMVLSDFVGAFPNAFYHVDLADLLAFIAAVQKLRGEDDYAALMTRFGIRRTDERFWAHSDVLHAAYRSWAPHEAGLFDYARIENR